MMVRHQREHWVTLVKKKKNVAMLPCCLFLNVKKFKALVTLIASVFNSGPFHHHHHHHRTVQLFNVAVCYIKLLRFFKVQSEMYLECLAKLLFSNDGNSEINKKYKKLISNDFWVQEIFWSRILLKIGAFMEIWGSIKSANKFEDTVLC